MRLGAAQVKLLAEVMASDDSTRAGKDAEEGTAANDT